jgi:hypothetical protein
LTAILLALLLAAPLTACGEEAQTAAEFCAEHGGVNPETVEDDGDASCQDGTPFEAEAAEDEKSSKKKRKR